MVDYENFYYGTPREFEPEYGEMFTGYRLDPSRIASETSPQTADQLKSVDARLREGVKSIEMKPMSKELFEQIPRDHFKQINEVAQLTGAEISFHAPWRGVDLVGFEEGGGWSESNREEAERFLGSFMDRAQEASPKENVAVAVHATPLVITKQWGERGEEKITMINKETGEAVPLRREEKFDPRTGRVEVKTPRELLHEYNDTLWHDKVRSFKERQKDIEGAYDEFRKVAAKMRERNEEIAANKKIIDERERKGEKIDRLLLRPEATKITAEEQGEYSLSSKKLKRANALASELSRSLIAAYPNAYKFDKDARGELEKNAAEYREAEATSSMYSQDLADAKKRKDEQREENDKFIIGQAIIYGNRALIKGLNKANPEMFENVEDFAKKRASTTIANVALSQFKKYGDNAKTIAVENFWPGTPFSRANELKSLIDESRRKFINKAMDDGLSKEEAKEKAERFIGATWDLGHINMLRGAAGASREDIIAESKKIAPYVKKVHLADNFGYYDSHLPPGMGDVPNKEILKELEKRGFLGPAVIEAGAFEAQFKKKSYPYAMEALGTSMPYATMAPYWSKSAPVESVAYGIPNEGLTPVFAPVAKELGGVTGKEATSGGKRESYPGME